MDDPSPCGRIEVIYGPMFSGKSTELIRRIHRHIAAKRRCLIVKYAKDCRYTEETDESIATHDRVTFTAKSCDRLSELGTRVRDYDVIAIDEGQFFPDIVSFCEDWANAGKIVLVACLDGTFQRKPFNNILELIPLAENVTKLSAICMICQRDAAFSKRLDSNDTRVEVIGGADKYIAVCRRCYFANAEREAIAEPKIIPSFELPCAEDLRP
eukprot:gnl/Trimastix_PCT/1542.p1 GENE.gnl/Trimastix_PCT/1542~~gnl/Trimastix_PCT/1542.p1  ORF type:complete len:234 (+),score=32.65 gnl/Trimastix_PCT/1542:69-704(+)